MLRTFIHSGPSTFKRLLFGTHARKKLFLFLITAVMFWSILLVAAVTNSEQNSNLASSVWPMFGHDAQHTARSVFVGPQSAIVKWSYNTGDFTVYPSPVVASDGTIYMGGVVGNYMP